MRKVDKRPENPEVLNCASHGDYQARYMPWVTGGYFISDYCPACAKEKEEQKEAEEKEKQDKYKADRLSENKRRAGISKRNEMVKFAQFIDDTEGKKIAKQKVYDMARSIHAGKDTGSLILTGKVGTGKTMLGCAAINAIIESRSCRMVKMIDMFREIKETWRRDSEITELDLIRRYSRLDLLVIDEAGVNYDSDTEKMFIFDIIDGRYQEMKPTIVITNLGIQELSQVMGERVIDRLRDGGGEAVAFDWESGRS